MPGDSLFDGPILRGQFVVALLVGFRRRAVIGNGLEQPLPQCRPGVLAGSVGQ
jgi:hypothetical protein